MLNFEGLSKAYRDRLWGEAEFFLSKMVEDHLLKGGEFDAQKITKMFGTAVCTAQLLLDLEIGTGLCPLREDDDDEVSNLGSISPPPVAP